MALFTKLNTKLHNITIISYKCVERDNLTSVKCTNKTIGYLEDNERYIQLKTSHEVMR